MGDAHYALGLRYQAVGHLLVHGRYWLGHGPHLHHLWPTSSGRERTGVRRHSDLPRRRSFLANDRETQGLDFLHGADSDPLADHRLGHTSRDGTEELR